MSAARAAARPGGDSHSFAALRRVLAATMPADPPEGAARSAVLVPLIAEPHGVLLTRRAESLRRHAGQVAFPGGRIDPEDATPEHAALREAREEIGLDPGRVDLIGRLPCGMTGTGFHVIPVVGCLADASGLRAAPEEVASIFVLPMQVLRDPGAPRQHPVTVQGREYQTWVWPHDEHRIWGATAAILVKLAAALREAG